MPTSETSDVNAEIPSAAWISIYVQRVENVKQSEPWSVLGIQVHAKDGDCETMGTKWKSPPPPPPKKKKKKKKKLNQGLCTSGQNLLILALGDELWCGQAQKLKMVVNFDF